MAFGVYNYCFYCCIIQLYQKEMFKNQNHVNINSKIYLIAIRNCSRLTFNRDLYIFTVYCIYISKLIE
jgi:hypothetical protein